jgi:cytochrome P450
MAVEMSSDVYYDPYDVDIYADPYPVFKRLRDEAPLYRNERYDFYALSRFADVKAAIGDPQTYSSAKGTMLETIHSDFTPPPGFFINEDPPIHSSHRSVLARVFTPRRVSLLEPQIRTYTAQLLDGLVDRDEFDFIGDLSSLLPMRVISMLLGIPDEDQDAIRLRADERLRREPGKANETAGRYGDGGPFGAYLDWRVENPSDDLMTELLNVEFEDETGTVRRLNRDEVLTYVNLLAAAGNETTNRLIGWMGKLLGEHPDQRRAVADDRSLVPKAVEEVLRFESPAINGCRYVTRDVEVHGQTVPAGSVMMLLRGAANHDERAFPPDGDVFDVQRSVGQHLSFGYGIHFCLGAALARIEARIVLDEVLDRIPDWEVDHDRAELDSAVVRGWRTLPVTISH